MKTLLIIFLLLIGDVQAQLRSVPYVDCADQTGFFISLKNVGSVTTRVKKSQLPWFLSSSSFSTAAFIENGIGGFEKLREIKPIWDTFHNPDVEIGAGKIITGFVSFDRIAVDFYKKRNDGSIIVRYSVYGDKFIQSTGLILVPKATTFSEKRCPAVLLQ